MPLFQLVLVALIQGITEFLPISSSGHLILLPALTGLDDQGQVRRHVAIFVDGERIDDRRHLSDRVGADSEVYVVQALSGG